MLDAWIPPPHEGSNKTRLHRRTNKIGVSSKYSKIKRTFHGPDSPAYDPQAHGATAKAVQDYMGQVRTM